MESLCASRSKRRYSSPALLNGCGVVRSGTGLSSTHDSAQIERDALLFHTIKVRNKLTRPLFPSILYCAIKEVSSFGAARNRHIS